MNLINLLTANIIISAAAGNGAAAGTDAAAGCTGTSMWSGILLYAVIIGAFYLIVMRPQNKRREQEEQMRKNVEVGDEIITIGGICGRVVSIKDDETIVVETGADRIKLKMKTWAVSSNETARGRQPAQPEKKGLLSGLFGKKDA